MNDKKKYLKESLLFRMSLGSKELFHSNVWAWLIEKDNNFIKVFFDNVEISEYKDISVSRETKNRDIIIWLKDKNDKKCYFVIENKIKSLPTREQLEKYSVDLWDNELRKAVFTGIINPFGGDFVSKKGKRFITWQYVSYSEIAKKIQKELCTSQKFSKFEREQVEEYCKIIEYMNDILFDELNQTQNKLLYSCNDDLHSLRIYDIYAKMLGAQFLNYLKNKEKEFENLDYKGFKLGMWQSFNNGKVTLDIRYSNWENNDKPWFLLGVQIEGNQYRFVAECNKKLENGMTCDELYNKMVASGWLDDSYTKDNKMIYGKPTSMSPHGERKYNSYKNKDDTATFIYQYYDITDESTEYDTLFDNIKNDLNKAADIIRKKRLL